MYGQTGYATKRDYDHARYLRLKAKREAQKPPVAISKLTEVEKAYIAGLIDGEGAIYMANCRGKTCYPTISIHITHEGVVRWLAEKTGSQKIHTIVPRKDSRYKSVLKTQYLYRTSGKKAQLLCQALMPYLHVKRNHAEVVSKFPVEARTAPGHKITPEINVLRYRLRDQLEALNDNRYKRRHS